MGEAEKLPQKFHEWKGYTSARETLRLALPQEVLWLLIPPELASLSPISLQPGATESHPSWCGIWLDLLAVLLANGKEQEIEGPLRHH